MAKLTPTRRGMLAAMALAPIVIAASASAALSPDLTARIAECAAAAQRMEDHKQVYAAIRAHYDALVAAIPHETIEWEANPSFAGETWTTADRDRIRDARYFLDPRHNVEIDPCAASYHKAALALVAADDRRQVAIKQADQQSGLSAAIVHDDNLLDAWTETLDAVCACPVSTLPDLARKVAFITDNKQWEYETTHAAVSADVARIAEGR